MSDENKNDRSKRKAQGGSGGGDSSSSSGGSGGGDSSSSSGAGSSSSGGGDDSGDKKNAQQATPKRRFQAGRGGTVDVSQRRGLRRIPVWLTREKGLPDWLAGAVVVVGSGLLLSLFVWILAMVWPA